MYYGEHSGIFAKYGLEVTIVSVSNGAAAPAALIGGDVIAKMNRSTDPEYVEARYIQPVIDALAKYRAIDQSFPGAVIRLDGRGDYYCNMFLYDVPAGGATSPQQHLFEEVVYVLERHGSTQLEFSNGTKRSFEWGARSLFAIPLNARRPIGTRPARTLMLRLVSSGYTLLPAGTKGLTTSIGSWIGNTARCSLRPPDNRIHQHFATSTGASARYLGTA